MELVSLPKNPTPSGATVGSFKGYDGTELRFARWDATRSPRRGTVCLFGGRNEFIEKYFEVIADLRRRGFAVATMDWRGQGGSQRKLANPRKGYVKGFWQYDRDLNFPLTLSLLFGLYPKIIGLGHSMGGNILLRNATMQGLWFERMVLCSPLLNLNEVTLQHSFSVVHLYAELGCAFGMSKAYVSGGTDAFESCNDFDENFLTTDRERWLRTQAVLDAAPHLGLGSPTVRWLRSALRSCRRISAESYPQRINVPLLLFAAGNDKVVSSRAIEDFAVYAKVSSCILMPGSRHEILQENDVVRTRFWAAFDAYVGVDTKVA